MLEFLSMVDKRYEIDGDKLLLLGMLCLFIGVLIVIFLFVELLVSKKQDQKIKEYEMLLEKLKAEVLRLKQEKLLLNKPKQDNRTYAVALRELPKYKRNVVIAFTNKLMSFDHITVKEKNRKLTFKHKKKTLATINIRFDVASLKIWVQNKSLLDASIELKPLLIKPTKDTNIDNLLFALDVAHGVFHEIQGLNQ